jgi:hypothetical protein
MRRFIAIAHQLRFIHAYMPTLRVTPHLTWSISGMLQRWATDINHGYAISHISSLLPTAVEVIKSTASLTCQDGNILVIASDCQRLGIRVFNTRKGNRDQIWK